MPFLQSQLLDFSHRPRAQEGLCVIGKASLSPSALWARQIVSFPSVHGSLHSLELSDPHLARWINSWTGPPWGFTKSEIIECFLMTQFPSGGIYGEQLGAWETAGHGDEPICPPFPSISSLNNISAMKQGALGLGVCWQSPSGGCLQQIGSHWVSGPTPSVAEPGKDWTVSSLWVGTENYPLALVCVTWKEREKASVVLSPHAEQADCARYGRRPCDLAHVYPPTLVSLTAVLHSTGLRSVYPTWKLFVHLKVFALSLCNSRKNLSPFLFSPVVFSSFLTGRTLTEWLSLSPI